MVLITCFNAIRPPLIPSDVRTPYLSIIPLFDTFFELLGSEVLKNTPVAKPWVIWLLLYCIQCMTCSGHWTCLYVNNLFRHYCGLAHIFTSTLVFIVKCAVHWFRSKLPECPALKILGQYIGPNTSHRTMFYFQVTFCHYIRYKEIHSLDVFGPLGTVELAIFLKSWHYCCPA